MGRQNHDLNFMSSRVLGPLPGPVTTTSSPGTPNSLPQWPPPEEMGMTETH